jgi:hypothetical protein
MNFEKFAIWLSGFADLNMGQVPTKEQWELIVERLAETFDQPAGPAVLDPGRNEAADLASKPADYGMWGGTGGSLVSIGRPNIGGAIARTAEFRPGDVTLAMTNTVTCAADAALASNVGALVSNTITSEAATRAR